MAREQRMRKSIRDVHPEVTYAGRRKSRESKEGSSLLLAGGPFRGNSCCSWYSSSASTSSSRGWGRFVLISLATGNPYKFSQGKPNGATYLSCPLQLLQNSTQLNTNSRQTIDASAWEAIACVLYVRGT